jgi:hypothetical protein
MSSNARVNDPVNIIHAIQDFPLVDGHMHIQSNDIAPIPIMRGIVEKQFFEKNPLNSDRLRAKMINFYELTFREFGERSNFPKVDDISPKENTLSRTELFESRRVMTDTAALVTQYGKITRENSYHVAGLYAGDLLDTPMFRVKKKSNL